VSTPRPKTELPEWRKDDVLEGYGAIIHFTVTVV